MSDENDEIVEEYHVEVYIDPETERVLGEIWYKEKGGPMHRENGPANQAFDIITGNLQHAEYMLDGELSRPGDEPAIIIYDPEKGVPTQMEFWVSGKLHRLSGPAVVRFDSVTGAVTHTGYYRNGVKQNPPEIFPDPLP